MYPGAGSGWNAEPKAHLLLVARLRIAGVLLSRLHKLPLGAAYFGWWVLGRVPSFNSARKHLSWLSTIRTLRRWYNVAHSWRKRDYFSGAINIKINVRIDGMINTRIWDYTIFVGISHGRKIKGQIEVTRRRGRRRKKLLDDLKDRRGYCQLKEEALDRTMWTNRFGRGFGPVVWQITDDDPIGTADAGTLKTVGRIMA